MKIIIVSGSRNCTWAITGLIFTAARENGQKLGRRMAELVKQLRRQVT